LKQNVEYRFVFPRDAFAGARFFFFLLA
jgi:hypothetical protein